MGPCRAHKDLVLKLSEHQVAILGRNCLWQPRKARHSIPNQQRGPVPFSTRWGSWLLFNICFNQLGVYHLLATAELLSLLATPMLPVKLLIQQQCLPAAWDSGFETVPGERATQTASSALSFSRETRKGVWSDAPSKDEMSRECSWGSPGFTTAKESQLEKTASTQVTRCGAECEPVSGICRDEGLWSCHGVQVDTAGPVGDGASVSGHGSADTLAERPGSCCTCSVCRIQQPSL